MEKNSGMQNKTDGKLLITKSGEWVGGLPSFDFGRDPTFQAHFSDVEVPFD